MMNSRLIAAQIIARVFEGQSLADALHLDNINNERDRAFIQALCYGVCRFYYRLDFILQQLLKKPLPLKEQTLHALLLVGLYQITGMRIPAHAAVAETVNATIKLKKPWAKGLVNAILREYLRREAVFDDLIKQDMEAYYAHPQWLIDAIQQTWPADWQSILEANNQHPPFSLRVNLARETRENYLQRLNDGALDAEIAPYSDSGIILKTPIAVEKLPGFKAGLISVQDIAAQLSAELLELKPDLHLLDACSAPGGKLIHSLDYLAANNATAKSYVVLEKDEKRMETIRENLVRFYQQKTFPNYLKLFCTDASKVSAWWNQQLFDRILLDAPCSASGVIRRHPDIKLLRRATDIDPLAIHQYELLTALWPTLAKEGLLVYITCSIFSKENEHVIKQFLLEHADAKEEKIIAPWGIEKEIGRQILPGMDNMDGFYFVKIRKI